MTPRPGKAAWIVLDGVGLGALPDAACYGDGDAATLPHVATLAEFFAVTMRNGQSFLGELR